MSKRNITIRRLAIRLKGTSPESARAAVGGLGGELQGRLTTGSLGSRRQPAASIARVDAGAVQLASDATPSQLRTTIADRIAASIEGLS